MTTFTNGMTTIFNLLPFMQDITQCWNMVICTSSTLVTHNAETFPSIHASCLCGYSINNIHLGKNVDRVTGLFHTVPFCSSNIGHGTFDPIVDGIHNCTLLNNAQVVFPNNEPLPTPYYTQYRLTIIPLQLRGHRTCLSLLWLPDTLLYTVW